MKRKLIAHKHGAQERVMPPTERAVPSSWIVYALMTMLSVLVPQTVVYGGLAPFGVSVVAAVEGMAVIPVSVGTAIGYLLTNTAVIPLLRWD